MGEHLVLLCFKVMTPKGSGLGFSEFVMHSLCK